MTAYRPYALSKTDLTTIRDAISANYEIIGGANRRSIVFRQMIKPKRRRPLADLMAIIPWKIMPTALGDLLRHLANKRRDAKGGSS